MYFHGDIFSLTSVQFAELLPYLALVLSFALAVIGSGLRLKPNFFRVLGFVGFGVACCLWLRIFSSPENTFLGLEGNAVTRTVGALVSVFGVFSFALFDVAERYEKRSEWLALTFLCVLGLTLLPASRDWASFFVFLETFSIPAYVLVAYDSQRERSLEASLKYMLSGAFASSLLLMGIALVYLTSGSLAYSVISANLPTGELSAIGVLMILAGVLFKLTAVPFHFWAPDVYQGAPLGVSAFLASATKLSVFAAAALAFEASGFRFKVEVVTATVIVGIASAVIGSFLAFTQRSFRRMVAYSGSVNAGMIAPLMVLGPVGARSGLFFLFVYSATTMILLACLNSLMKKRGGDANEDLDIESLSRQDSQRAWLETFLISAALISMAGIPPFPGFVAKYWAFMELWQMGHRGLVIAALFSTLLGVAYYIRIAGKFYFSESRKVVRT